MQIVNPTPAAMYSGITNAVAQISSTEGVRSLWRGIASVAVGAGMFMVVSPTSGAVEIENIREGMFIIFFLSYRSCPCGLLWDLRSG